jgi:hypothetical protein
MINVLYGEPMRWAINFPKTGRTIFLTWAFNTDHLDISSTPPAGKLHESSDGEVQLLIKKIFMAKRIWGTHLI